MDAVPTCALKKTRLEECHRLLYCYESESNDFLYSVVMGEDRWVYHNNTELKSHSLEYSHPFLPEIKNARLNIPLENAFT